MVTGSVVGEALISIVKTVSFLESLLIRTAAWWWLWALNVDISLKKCMVVDCNITYLRHLVSCRRPGREQLT